MEPSRLVRRVFKWAWLFHLFFSYQALTQIAVCGQVIVADTFEEIVSDPEKDMLIEFYAPWCGHCKKLEPKYTELGERVSFTWHQCVFISVWITSHPVFLFFLWSQLYSDPNIVIAKMDATANDIPQGYDVQGYVFSRSSNAL